MGRRNQPEEFEVSEPVGFPVSVDEPPAEQLVRPSRKPPEKDIVLSARQYVRTTKISWERAVGFLHEMKSLPGNKTRSEWDALWARFWDRPVK